MKPRANKSRYNSRAEIYEPINPPTDVRSWTVAYFALSLSCNNIIHTLYQVWTSPLNLKWWASTQTCTKVIEVRGWPCEGVNEILEVLIDPASPIHVFLSINKMHIDLPKQLCKKAKLNFVDDCISQADLTLDRFQHNTTFIIADSVLPEGSSNEKLVQFLKETIAMLQQCRIVLLCLGVENGAFGRSHLLSQDGSFPENLLGLDVDFCWINWVDGRRRPKPNHSRNDGWYATLTRPGYSNICLDRF